MRQYFECTITRRVCFSCLLCLVLVAVYTSIPRRNTPRTEVHLSHTTAAPPSGNAALAVDRSTDLDNGPPSWNESIAEEAMTSVSRVVFNRVPKCGSTAVLKLFGKVQTVKKIWRSSKTFLKFSINEHEQKVQADEISRFPTPTVFDRHVYFLDFEKFGLPPPVYINVVRDPVDRLVSWYYYMRHVSKKMKMTPARRNMPYDKCVLNNDTECMSTPALFTIVPFFCGQDDMCRIPNRKSLHQAMKHVVDHYPVVGVTEDLAGFFQVLEAIFPKVFKGTHKRFITEEASLKASTSQKKKLPLSEATRDMIRPLLQEEYEFYYWIRQRFYEQKKRIHAKPISHF